MSENSVMASELTFYDLLVDQVASHTSRVAVQHAEQSFTYAELLARVDQIGALLLASGADIGARVAILSENRWEFLAALFACARTGAIATCMNWRQTVDELAHCARLVSPLVALVSQRFMEHEGLLREAGVKALHNFDDGFLAKLDAAPLAEPARPRSEDGFQIIYTSGTTGMPKAALISHRAAIARGMLSAGAGVIPQGSTFISWPPMFHTAGTEYSVFTLLRGGKVVIVDGAKIDELCRLITTEDNLGWFNLMPGMLDRVIDALRANGVAPKPVTMIGSGADMIQRHTIVEATTFFNAPFRNTFASTECGPVPGSGNLVPVGQFPENLDKTQAALCRIRLVDEEGNDVADGEPGEMLVRSPTLFSGYWNAPEVNAEVFAGGWFHTGDVMVRTPEGNLRFVDRRKYLIKSGGENIYPSEIETILMASERILDAVVVRRKSDRWGEVPVAFVVRRDDSLTAEDVMAMCEGRIARYKLPRDVVFVAEYEIPRNLTGKPLRGQLEERLA